MAVQYNQYKFNFSWSTHQIHLKWTLKETVHGASDTSWTLWKLLIIDFRISKINLTFRCSTAEVFLQKGVCKYAANVQDNTLGKVW